MSPPRPRPPRPLSLSNSNPQQQQHYKHDGTIWHRHHLERVRVCLRYIATFEETGTTSTRIMYKLHTTWKEIPKFLTWMEDKGLIKLRTREGFERVNTPFMICITKKGIRLLELLDQQAKMIPTAPWLEENTE